MEHAAADISSGDSSQSGSPSESQPESEAESDAHDGSNKVNAKVEACHKASLDEKATQYMENGKSRLATSEHNWEVIASIHVYLLHAGQPSLH